MITNTSRMWGMRKYLASLVKVQIGAATMEISVAVSYSKKELDLPNDPAIPLLGIYPKDSISYYRDTCS